MRIQHIRAHALMKLYYYCSFSCLSLIKMQSTWVCRWLVKTPARAACRGRCLHRPHEGKTRTLLYCRNLPAVCRKSTLSILKNYIIFMNTFIIKSKQPHAYQPFRKT